MNNVKNCRPGRKIAAQRRKDARLVLQNFVQSDDFKSLTRPVQLAILTINPSLKETY